MSKRYALVDSNGLIQNVIIWDGVSEWSPPDGLTEVEDTAQVATIGGTYLNGVFTAPPPPPPLLPPPPRSVSRMQAIVALSRAGLLDAVTQWVASQGAETKLVWDNAPEFARDSAMLNAAGAALGLTSDQMDALFASASSIAP